MKLLDKAIDIVGLVRIIVDKVNELILKVKDFITELQTYEIYFDEAMNVFKKRQFFKFIPDKKVGVVVGDKLVFFNPPKEGTLITLNYLLSALEVKEADGCELNECTHQPEEVIELPKCSVCGTTKDIYAKNDSEFICSSCDNSITQNQ